MFKTETNPKTNLADGTVHKLPSDILQTIASGKKMIEMWQSITPLVRNEWICWTITYAKPETRAKHIVVMRHKMHKGMRRPCCWSSCIHR